MNLFADNIALNKIIGCHDDYSILQADIDAISDCLCEKFLTLNLSKCCGSVSACCGLSFNVPMFSQEMLANISSSSSS